MTQAVHATTGRAGELRHLPMGGQKIMSEFQMLESGLILWFYLSLIVSMPRFLRFGYFIIF